MSNFYRHSFSLVIYFRQEKIVGGNFQNRQVSFGSLYAAFGLKIDHSKSKVDQLYDIAAGFESATKNYLRSEAGGLAQVMSTTLIREEIEAMKDDEELNNEPPEDDES